MISTGSRRGNWKNDCTKPRRLYPIFFECQLLSTACDLASDLAAVNHNNCGPPKDFGSDRGKT